MTYGGTATPNSEASAGMSARDRWALGIFLAGLVLALYGRFTATPPTLWGLLPIVVYALLVLLAVDVVLATLAGSCPPSCLRASGQARGGHAGAVPGSFIAVVGLIIIMGAGLGQVAKDTGAAEYLVRTVLYQVGLRTRTRVQVG